MTNLRDSVEIREAEPEDYPALARLMTELGHPTSGDRMRERMDRIVADGSSVTLTAGVAGEVVGMAGLQFSRAYEVDGVQARLVALVVASESRGQGIGRALLDSCEVLARKAGAERIMLNSHLRRESAHLFYESRDYEKNGFRFVKCLPEG